MSFIVKSNGGVFGIDGKGNDIIIAIRRLLEPLKTTNKNKCRRKI